MKIRVRLDLIFDIIDQDTAEAVKDYAVKLKDKLKTIRPSGEYFIEKSSIQLEKCYHDEDPPKACEIISQWESD